MVRTSQLLSPLFFLLASCTCFTVCCQTTETSRPDYFAPVKAELEKRFPQNKRINLVFHGHSVPSGYWSKQEVHTLESYPNLLLKKLKQRYPYAVINIIITATGGEYAEKGQMRFADDVLPHKPDILFIDYALNDLGIGLERSRAAWEKMISEALGHGITVVLLTPSPDQRHDLRDPANPLALHAAQIREIAKKFNVAVADPYATFENIARSTGSIESYMSHVNHPNEKGHDIIAEQIFRLLN